MSILVPILHCLDHCSCAVSFEIRKHESSTLFWVHLNFWYQTWWELWMNSRAWGLGPILKASCQEHRLQVWHLPWRDGFPPSQPTAPHDKSTETFCREQWSPWVILNITLCLPYLLCSLIALSETVSFTTGLLMNLQGAQGVNEGGGFQGRPWGAWGPGTRPALRFSLPQESLLSFLSKQEITKLRLHCPPQKNIASVWWPRGIL